MIFNIDFTTLTTGSQPVYFSLMFQFQTSIQLSTEKSPTQHVQKFDATRDCTDTTTLHFFVFVAFREVFFIICSRST